MRRRKQPNLLNQLYINGCSSPPHRMEYKLRDTVVAATDHTAVSFETFSLEVTPILTGGVINIESTQSGVFCNAIFLDAAGGGLAFNLPLVRVNPHPGTVE